METPISLWLVAAWFAVTLTLGLYGGVRLHIWWINRPSSNRSPVARWNDNRPSLLKP
jgi:hypothetical protein